MTTKCFNTQTSEVLPLSAQQTREWLEGLVNSGKHINLTFGGMLVWWPSSYFFCFGKKFKSSLLLFDAYILITPKKCVFCFAHPRDTKMCGFVSLSLVPPKSMGFISRSVRTPWRWTNFMNSRKVDKSK